MLGYINIIYNNIYIIILYKYFQANAVSTVLIHFYIIFLDPRIFRNNSCRFIQNVFNEL